MSSHIQKASLVRDLSVKYEQKGSVHDKCVSAHRHISNAFQFLKFVVLNSPKLRVAGVANRRLALFRHQVLNDNSHTWGTASGHFLGGHQMVRIPQGKAVTRERSSHPPSAHAQASACVHNQKRDHTTEQTPDALALFREQKQASTQATLQVISTHVAPAKERKNVWRRSSVEQVRRPSSLFLGRFEQVKAASNHLPSNNRWQAHTQPHDDGTEEVETRIRNPGMGFKAPQVMLIQPVTPARISTA